MTGSLYILRNLCHDEISSRVAEPTWLPPVAVARTLTLPSRGNGSMSSGHYAARRNLRSTGKGSGASGRLSRQRAEKRGEPSPFLDVEHRLATAGFRHKGAL